MRKATITAVFKDDVQRTLYKKSYHGGNILLVNEFKEDARTVCS